MTKNIEEINNRIESFKERIEPNVESLKDRYNEQVVFALNQFNPEISKYIKEVERVKFIHPENMILPVLCAYGQAIGERFSLRTQFSNKSNIYGLTLGLRGRGKSPSISEAFKPLRFRDKQLSDDYKSAKSLEDKNEVNKVKRKHALISSNISPEALGKNLVNSGSMLLELDEFDSMLSHLKKGNGGGEQWRGLLNNLFTSTSYKSVYIKDEDDNIETDNAVFTIMANTHPHSFDTLNGGYLQTTGFADRFLYMPLLNKDKLIKKHTLEIDDSRYITSFNNIYSLKNDVEVMFSEESYDSLIKCINEIKSLKNSSEKHDPNFAAYCSKLEIYLHKLILILHVIDDSLRVPVDSYILNTITTKVKTETIERAYNLIQFFIYTWKLSREEFSKGEEKALSNSQIVKEIFTRWPKTTGYKLSKALSISETAISKHRNNTG